MTNKAWVAVQSEVSVIFVTVRAETVGRYLAVKLARLAKASSVYC